MLQQSPACHEALYGQAKNHLALREYPLAIEGLRQALKIKRKDATYMIWIGVAYLYGARELHQQMCEYQHQYSRQEGVKTQQTKEKYLNESYRYFASTFLFVSSV